jgi:hypothetical protein
MILTRTPVNPEPVKIEPRAAALAAFLRVAFSIFMGEPRERSERAFQVGGGGADGARRGLTGVRQNGESRTGRTAAYEDVRGFNRARRRVRFSAPVVC